MAYRHKLGWVGKLRSISAMRILAVVVLKLWYGDHYPLGGAHDQACSFFPSAGYNSQRSARRQNLGRIVTRLADSLFTSSRGRSI